MGYCNFTLILLGLLLMQITQNGFDLWLKSYLDSVPRIKKDLKLP